MQEIVQASLSGLSDLLSLNTFVYVLIGTLLGVVVGFIPGIGGNFLLAVMLPFTFKMDPLASFALLLSAHSVIGTGGAVSAILFNTPGSGMNAATVLDGFPLTKQGKSGQALGAALMSSMVGGLIGVVALIALIPVMRPMVLAFGPAEFFMLTLLGICFISSLGGDASKGLIMGVLGLFLATVGQDPISGETRFAFGTTYLWDGIKVIPTVIGMFAVTEMIALGIKGGSIVQTSYVSTKIGKDIIEGCKSVFIHWWLTLRSSVIGVFIGFLPGLGGEAASFFTYGQAMQTSKNPEKFGKGSIEGVIAPEAANNSKEGGVLIPTIGFGIPGSSAMAILLGAFLIQGIVPGRQMLTEELDLVFSMTWAVAIANVIGCLILLPSCIHISKLIYLRGTLLIPVILTLAMLGSYTGSNQMADLIFAGIIGTLGYILLKILDYPPAPLLLGLVLGEIAEKNMMIAYRLYGYDMFFRPIALTILILIVIVLLLPVYKAFIKKGGASVAK